MHVPTVSVSRRIGFFGQIECFADLGRRQQAERLGLLDESRRAAAPSIPACCREISRSRAGPMIESRERQAITESQCGICHAGWAKSPSTRNGS